MKPFNHTKIPLFLIGYRCTGKTTIGKLLAQMLERPFVDTDAALESRFNISIAKMVETKGWEYFRAKETKGLTGLDLSQAPIVATGGGVVLAKENRDWIKASGHCIWLHADALTLISRIRSDAPFAGHRPDLSSQNLEEETRQLLEIRTPLYRELAGITINTAEHSPAEAARHIIRRIDHERL